jgi:hypothetical protein
MNLTFVVYQGLTLEVKAGNDRVGFIFPWDWRWVYEPISTVFFGKEFAKAIANKLAELDALRRPHPDRAGVFEMIAPWAKSKNRAL